MEVLSILVIDVLKWKNGEYKTKNYNDLKDAFKTNFEGGIEIYDFNYDLLYQYSKDESFTPCAREIFSILCYLKDLGILF